MKRGLEMKIRRKVALLATAAFVWQGLMVAAPKAFAGEDDDLAAFAYWKLPLGYGGSKQTEPTFGFALSQTHDGWLMAPAVNGVDQVQLPALVDLHFGGNADDALPSLSFSGIDVGMVIDQALHQNGPGPAPNLGEWILIGAGVALGGITACAAAGCFDDDDDNVAAELPRPP